MDISGWDELIKNSFFLESVYIQPKAKKLLLSQNLDQRKVLLNALTSGNMAPWWNVLQEPERTLLGLSFQEAQSRYQQIKQMMAWGLAQNHAERFYETYGSQACESPLARVEALLAFGSQSDLRSALSSTEPGLSSDHRAVLETMSWLLAQARSGRTLFHEAEVPERLTEGLRLGARAGLIVTNDSHFQLKPHAMLQVSVRRQFERFSQTFFPIYSTDEILFSYSRYSQVVASFDHIHLQDEIAETINSRISIIRPRDLDCLHEFMAQLSATLQILHASAPLLVVYSSAMNQIHELYAEDEPLPFYQLPRDVPAYSTLMVTDCDLFSLSDFLVTLQKIPATSRLVLIDSRSARPKATPHFLDVLAHYFNVVDVTCDASPQGLLSSQNKIPSEMLFDIQDAEQRHKIYPEEVFVSDHPAIVDAINQRLSRTRSPVVLETLDKSFRKHDRVWLRPAYSSKWDPFICTIHSVSAKGLFVEMNGQFATLSTQVIQDAVVTHGFAMTPTAAVKAGASSVAIITSHTHRAEWTAYLTSYGLTVRHSFVHDLTPNKPPEKGLAYQRLAPLVE